MNQHPLSEEIFRAIKANNHEAINALIETIGVDQVCELRDTSGYTVLGLAVSEACSSDFEVTGTLETIQLVNQLTEGRLLNVSRIRDGWSYETPLIEASQEGQLEVMRYLLEQSECKVNAQAGRGDGFCTPLIMAIRHEKLEAACLLLEHKADTSIFDAKGYQAVHYLAKNVFLLRDCLLHRLDDTEIEQVKQILPACAAHVNTPTQDNQQQTPLHLLFEHVACYGKLYLLSLLLKAGADPNLRDAQGNDAFYWLHGDDAKKKKFLRIVIPYGYKNTPNANGKRSFSEELYQEVIGEVKEQKLPTSSPQEPALGDENQLTYPVGAQACASSLCSNVAALSLLDASNGKSEAIWANKVLEAAAEPRI